LGLHTAAEISLLLASLQKLVGVYRQLLEVVRTEKETLVSADLRAIQEITSRKQALLETIRQEETARLKLVAELAMKWKTPAKEITASALAVQIQGQDLKTADQLRSVSNALTVLIKRAAEQNEENKSLVQKSLEHICAMKRNVLGESTEKANTYNPQGQKSRGAGGSRFVSKEA
jgi:flagellar biosynthesis/type III secretory pathway chaperone